MDKTLIEDKLPKKKAAANNNSNFKNDFEGYIQQGYNKAILDFIHELDNYCGYYEGKNKNLTRDGVLEVAEQLRKKINDEACDDDNTAKSGDLPDKWK